MKNEARGFAAFVFWFAGLIFKHLAVIAASSERNYGNEFGWTILAIITLILAVLHTILLVAPLWDDRQ